MSAWSAGVEDIEASIHAAMVQVVIIFHPCFTNTILIMNDIHQAISESEHYVYIENQFFISSVGGGGEIKNGVAGALMQRIIKAHK